MLGGLLRPTDGQITIGGQPLYNERGCDKSLVRRIGFAFQDPNLLPWRTILRNVTLPLELQKMSAAERDRKGRQMLELVGLDTATFGRLYPRQLSGGCVNGWRLPGRWFTIP